jgi:AcrR family transcriptional regulator
MTNKSPRPALASRQTAEEVLRPQIIAAANEYFAKYGYGRTTMSELAKATGISKAYIYRFFESKQAIGEEICSACLNKIHADATAAAADTSTASEKLRILLRTVVSLGAKLFFNDRELYDIAAHASLERWQSYQSYSRNFLSSISSVLLEGRARGEFERKTALDETARAIEQAMEQFTNPVMLATSLDRVPDRSNELIAMILRSLSP